MASRTDYDRYISFPQPEDRDRVAAMLKAEGIPFKVVDNANQFDAFFTYNQANVAYSILMPASRFADADRILESAYDVEADQIPEDYYLREFSDEELIEVLVQADDWSIEDRVIAKSLLQSRGVSFNAEQIRKDREARRWKKVEPVPVSKTGLIAAYVMVVAMPLYSLIFGLWVVQARQTAPDGSKVPYYDKPSRLHAAVFAALSSGTTAFYIYISGFGEAVYDSMPDVF